MTRPSTSARLNDALTRLLAGQATLTDGQLNVANLCREARVGRDSYYRSPQTFKTTFQAARTNQAGQRPELVTARLEIAELKREHKRVAREHADTVRALQETIKTYANQIQALTLANAGLGERSRQLREQLEEREPNLTRLADHR
jgi:hypothetical protein